MQVFSTQLCSAQTTFAAEELRENQCCFKFWSQVTCKPAQVANFLHFSLQMAGYCSPRHPIQTLCLLSPRTLFSTSWSLSTPYAPQLVFLLYTILKYKQQNCKNAGSYCFFSSSLCIIIIINYYYYIISRELKN